ncbi:MAG: spermidine synthase [Beggiatoa sp. IS2]|nr:MAG: spermidine synthase [Beggiatoa sp. IS2]
MNLDNHWFTEVYTPGGTAFSLRIRDKLHEEQTPYQHIAIYDTTDFGKLMVLDGAIMLTDRDNFIYHEMMTHVPLFTHAHPRKVVIIGGGDCGTLREVLKHPTVEEVLQVEIDERVTRLAEQYFPRLCEANQDSRAKFLFADGIQWMANAPENSVDVVIIDSTDPVGPATGLFQAPFYQHCRRVLGKQGIVLLQSESPLLHVSLLQSIHRSLREAGFTATRTVHFPQCVYPSGWWSATLAGDGDLANFRVNDAKDKVFSTSYYHADIHQASLVLPAFLQESLP